MSQGEQDSFLVYIGITYLLLVLPLYQSKNLSCLKNQEERQIGFAFERKQEKLLYYSKNDSVRLFEKKKRQI